MKSLSPIQQAVLHHFAQFRTERFYLRELARVLAQDPGNLSRVLKSLTTKGYLEKAQEGNLTYFSLRPEENVNSFGLKIDNARLRAYLKEREPEIVKFAQNLIRTPSVSGVDPEQKIAALIYGRATQLGLYPRQVAKDRSRPNLVIDLDEKPTGSKSYFLLVGHMDTIGTGEIDNWDYYPFSGHVAGGNLYGRGAIDMKAGIACELYTLKAIKDLNLQLPVAPRILLVSNEEGGSTATPIFPISANPSPFSSIAVHMASNISSAFSDNFITFSIYRFFRPVAFSTRPMKKSFLSLLSHCISYRGKNH